ncbi:MAG: GNAT family N-acetyltransferase [Xanthomonadales bacterium]|nr:GNAT family N-acetyltransferase [Xanthomonadales bacterium]NIX12094.1 GNAT family N-acetyltransferase [Xanthomonadales bacterium]
MAEPLRVVESRRLRLVAASLSVVTSDLKGRAELAEALKVGVPDNWPPDLFDRRAMEFAQRELLIASVRGWSFWYLVLKSPKDEQLVGICGFKGRPDPSGSVEIGYSILSQFRNRGYATEAVARLVMWAFSHSTVSEVCAETMPHLGQSIRVLQKNGFRHTGPGSERGVIRYAVRREALN